MKQYGRPENERSVSKMAAEHPRVDAPPWLQVVSGSAIRPATSRGGHQVIAGDGTNGLPTLGPTSRVGGNCSGGSLEMRGATTGGRSVQPSQRAGLEEDWWTWEPAQ